MSGRALLPHLCVVGKNKTFCQPHIKQVYMRYMCTPAKISSESQNPFILRSKRCARVLGMQPYEFRVL